MVLGAPLVSFTGIRVLLLQASENIPLNKESVQTLSPRGAGAPGGNAADLAESPPFPQSLQETCGTVPGPAPRRVKVIVVAGTTERSPDECCWIGCEESWERPNHRRFPGVCPGADAATRPRADAGCSELPGRPPPPWSSSPRPPGGDPGWCRR